MRPGNNSRRLRGRPNRKQHVSPRAQVYDSHGPDCRIRGNAPQVYEKYLGLARDATSSGDRVSAESYYQFAEHYFRIMNDSTDPQRANPQRQEGRSEDQSSQDARPDRSEANEGRRSEGNEGRRSEANEGRRSEGNRGDGPRGEASRSEPPAQTSNQSPDALPAFISGEQPHVEWPDSAPQAKGKSAAAEADPADEQSSSTDSDNAAADAEGQATTNPEAAEAETTTAKPRGRPRRKAANGATRKTASRKPKAENEDEVEAAGDGDASEAEANA